MAIGEGGMGPDDQSPGVPIRWVEQMSAADFIVTLGREPGDNEISLLIEQEESVAVLYDESVAPADGFAIGRGFERFPEARTGLGIEAAKLPVAAHAIDVTVLQEWRAHHGVEVSSILLARLLRLPGHLGFVLFKAHHHRAIVE